MHAYACACLYVHMCMLLCVLLCVLPCVLACACMRACMRMCMHAYTSYVSNNFKTYNNKGMYSHGTAWMLTGVTKGLKYKCSNHRAQCDDSVG